MEAQALTPGGATAAPAPALLGGRSPLLRLQSDERLVAMVRRDNAAAFEALVARYQSRLLSFCRHILGSREDAEDVLQEVFAAAFGAMRADERPINVRPWLYRIARNRSLNHLRRVQAVGVDSMDVHYADNGQTTADRVHRREDFRQLIADVGELPESQRTALLLREIDALSYDQIAEAMETTVSSVKSLLVRARVSLAEAAEARKLTCAQVRLELGEVAEGLKRTSAPVRRHVRGCERCRLFRTELRRNNRALAVMLPVGPLLLIKKLVLAHFGTTAAAGGGGATAAGGAAAGGAAAGGAAGGALSAGAAAVATKAAAGLAAAAIVTAGAVEVRQVARDSRAPSRAAAAAVPAAKPPAPVAVASVPQPQSPPHPAARPEEPKPAPAAAPAPVATAHPPASEAPSGPVQEVSDTTTLPPESSDQQAAFVNTPVDPQTGPPPSDDSASPDDPAAPDPESGAQSPPAPPPDDGSAPPPGTEPAPPPSTEP